MISSYHPPTMGLVQLSCSLGCSFGSIKPVPLSSFNSSTTTRLVFSKLDRAAADQILRRSKFIPSVFGISRRNKACTKLWCAEDGISTTPSTKAKEHGGGEAELSSSNSWVDLYLPKEARPYARLARVEKQIGTWLLAWPCLWSISLAASPGHLPDVKLLALLGCWALIFRGAACTVNDILDRDIDAMVERTKSRPIASGALTPLQGFYFLAFQTLLGFGVLFQLNSHSCILGFPFMLLAFTYPLMKRLTYWPQAYLGLAWSWGSLLGWSAVKGSLDLTVVLPLYISGILWTLVYDTIYAHQDKEDDLKAGVKSTALKFGDSTKKWITGFGIACICSLALAGYNADIGWPFYALLAAASGQLAWQILTVDLSSQADCDSKFRSNKWFGGLIFSGILLGRILY